MKNAVLRGDMQAGEWEILIFLSKGAPEVDIGSNPMKAAMGLDMPSYILEAMPAISNIMAAP